MSQSYLNEIVLDVGTKSVKVSDIPRLFTLAIHRKRKIWFSNAEPTSSIEKIESNKFKIDESAQFCHLITAINRGKLVVHSYMTWLPLTQPLEPISWLKTWMKYRDNEDDYILDCIVSAEELVKYAEHYRIKVSIKESKGEELGTQMIDNQTCKSHLQDDVIDTNKPWLIHNPIDPAPKYDWYISARYFARELINENPLLLNNRNLMAQKVNELLTKSRIFKRGGKKPPSPDTILKAFSNVNFG